MSDTTTWAVLADGIYIRIMVNTGNGNRLVPLRTDDFEHTSKLTYAMVVSKRQVPTEAGSTKKWDYYGLLADFLAQEYEKKAFDALVLAAPGKVLKALHKVLPTEVEDAVIGELKEDLLAKSVDVLEKVLGEIIEGKQK